MRRRLLLVTTIAVLAAIAGTAVWIAKRTVRWNDARTMPPPLEAAVRAYAKGDDDAGLRHVRTLLRKYRAPAWEPRARVLAAARLARRGKDAEIPDVLTRDLPDRDALAGKALVLRARGFASRGDPSRAAELARRAVLPQGSPFAEEARGVLVNALEAAGDWREALRVLDATPSASDAADAARISVAHKDEPGARRRLVAALREAAEPEDTAVLIAAFETLLPDAATRFEAADRSALVVIARRLVEDNHAQAALDLLHLVRPTGNASEAPPAEALVEAEALLRVGRGAQARLALARAMQGQPFERDGARYVEARLSADAGQFGAYRAALTSLGRQGMAPWRNKALWDLAKAGEGVPSPSTLDAYRRYRIAAGPDADPLALLREAWAAFELGRTSEADAGFARALARPDAPGGVRVTALYWRARLVEAGAQQARARDLFRQIVGEFPNHYYGTLAARRIGAPAPAAAPDPEPVRDPAGLHDAARWLSAARQLASVGLWDDASPCFRAAIDGAGEHRMSVAVEAAAAARQAASLSDAVTFAQRVIGDRDRARPETVPRSLWRLVAPAPSADAIRRAARESGFDPALVAAVALQESAFNPLAVSSAGARGLLQVMPGVGAELARRLRIGSFDANDLFEPETNLRLGCAHLKDYVARFGSLPSGLAAYNGGPSRVERWTAARPRDDERFVERIPIPETRLYVKRVLAGSRIYAIAWPGGLGVE